MSGLPAEEVLEIGTPEQFKALSHPTRQRLLFALGQKPATISGLASTLSVHKGSVGHHLKVLRDAGMVRVVETRQVRGGTEQLYQRTARKLVVHEAPAEHNAAVFAAMAHEVSRAAEPLVSLRHLRLTATAAERLGAELQRLLDEAEDAGDDEAVHGVLVALYRRSE
ncbi:ArsR/SmtB family transcription factor [Umezawaea endophytica]|uniref:Helix-turn-helix domain-containing protein n=1 Tax=Umezawaea endophytica TaxID=1654476 RepID=A0A9X2VKD6_9PSEU|nr:winged helix-turn-helix domain-containing protein [Umezawaea endophytica]MCS7478250.1 helix-turn-helix domain-containing protein [Umezawaea endophytica]